MARFKYDKTIKRILQEDIYLGYLKTMASVFFKCPIIEINNNRKWKFVEIRSIIMYITFYNSDLSLKTIAHYFGKKDHTAVIHARRVTQNKIDTEREFRERFNEFIDFLGLEKIKKEEAA